MVRYAYVLDLVVVVRLLVIRVGVRFVEFFIIGLITKVNVGGRLFGLGFVVRVVIRLIILLAVVVVGLIVVVIMFMVVVIFRFII